MAEYKINWSSDARSDLYSILSYYIDRNGNSTYSKNLYSRIINSVNQLTINPLLGKKTQYHHVRVLITGYYEIVYELFDQLILIIMIWDCRRNPKDKKIGIRRKK